MCSTWIIFKKINRAKDEKVIKAEKQIINNPQQQAGVAEAREI